MDTVSHYLSIPTINYNTNFWMIRTKRGFFFNEYIRNGFIAIGWNLLTRDMIGQELNPAESERLKSLIKDTYHEKKPGTSLNKCIRFCYELKCGDIAVIVDNNRVAFAYIGDYYEEISPEFSIDHEKEVHSLIENADPRVDKFSCPYVKRRRITLIRRLGADDILSPYLQSAFARNWHSLSDLNEYSELILSGCFDTVIYKSKLIITFRVKCKEEINVLDLTNFILCAARLLSDNRPETVQVKTTLHSPGDIILQITNFIEGHGLALLLCYLIVFGGKVGNYELNSIISIIKDIIHSKHDKEILELNKRKLAAEADKTEQEAIALRIKNEEKLRMTRDTMVDSCAQSLAEAAENLDVQASETTIIDISEVLKRYDENRNS